MRIIVVAIVLVAAGCEKSNPNACCDTDQQCAALGVSKPLPCKPGQTCSPGFVCVAAECATSADCMDPNAPVCIDKLCVAKCTVDDDCIGAAGTPFCASDGACVGCTSDAQCSADKPFCDAQERSCRGCIEDSECASGVCIDATASCAAPSSILYVSSLGTDAGGCTQAAPCATIAFALQKFTPTTNVIRVSGMLAAAPTIAINHQIIIDANAAVMHMPASGAMFSVATTNDNAALTLEGLVVQGAGVGGSPIATVGTAASLVLVKDKVQNGELRTNGGSITVLDTALESSTVTCSIGSVDIERTTFAQTQFGGVSTMNCQLTLARSRLDPAFDAVVDAVGGLVAIENNIFVIASEFADAVHARASASGSKIAFNTIVNTSSVLDTPVAITCDGTQTVTSNIIAYNSSNPVSGCTVHNSLFDLAAGAAAQGNLMADKATFFKDLFGKDFHLSAASPAKNAGESGIVTIDFDGNVRPQPTGSNPDIGALESP